MVVDEHLERVLVGIAHALYMNRLHLLRLTEVVRLGIRPLEDDGIMEVPPELDRELSQQAFNFVVNCFPSEMSAVLHHAKADWMRLA